MTITIIRNVRLFDGEEVHPEATVAFDSQSGLITAVSSSSKDAPTTDGNAEVINGEGKTLVPGLIDAHIHAHDLHLPEDGDASKILKYPLKAGVTTVCDMFSDTATIHAHRKALGEDFERAKQAGQSGKVEMADLKSSTFGATIDGGWPKPVVLGHDPSEDVKAAVSKWPSVTVENAEEFIAQRKADGADYIKLMQEDCCSLAMPTGAIPSATLELQTAVVKAAHAAGLQCYGHATSVGSTEIVLKSGADGTTHTFIDQTPTKEIIDLYKQTGGLVIPTLVILSSLVNEEAPLRAKFADIASKKGIIDDWARQSGIEVLGMKAETAKLEYAYESVRQLKKAGIDVVAGTDSAAGLKGTIIGPSLWMELEMYVEKCGFSIVDALKSATSVTARRFKFNDRGLVKAGKRADLVLVNGDLTTDLSRLWEGDGIVGVWKQGIPAAR